ncbi:MAG TPA: arginase family protein, partial [Candidatus Angelobacter sp.]|nr:arginase family protein [Candidatus Angelobacter sp.]
ATVAAVRRYFRNVGMIFMDRDADLNTPATTTSGCVDGMVVSHLSGRGAAELVRFWGEPPLVREPDLALFGVDRLDPPEEEVLRQSPLRRYLASDVQRMGATAAAQAAVDRIHSSSHEFVLHFDVDVISDFQATNHPGTGGLSLEEVREALLVFVQQKHLAAFEVTAYNPTKDPDGTAAKQLVDLLADVLEKRLETLKTAAMPAAQPERVVSTAAATQSAAAGSSNISSSSSLPPAVPSPEATAEPILPAATPGEAWSAESLEDVTAAKPSGEQNGAAETSSEQEGS